MGERPTFIQHNTLLNGTPGLECLFRPARAPCTRAEESYLPTTIKIIKAENHYDGTRKRRQKYLCGRWSLRSLTSSIITAKPCGQRAWVLTVFALYRVFSSFSPSPGLCFLCRTAA